MNGNKMKSVGGAMVLPKSITDALRRAIKRAGGVHLFAPRFLDLVIITTQGEGQWSQTKRLLSFRRFLAFE